MKVAYVEKQHREVKIFLQLRECGGGCTNKTLSFQVGVLHSVYDYLIFFSYFLFSARTLVQLFFRRFIPKSWKSFRLLHVRCKKVSLIYWHLNCHVKLYYFINSLWSSTDVSQIISLSDLRGIIIQFQVTMIYM